MRNIAFTILCPLVRSRIKLSKLSNPVKQKSMFYREQIGKECRYRSVSGYFISMKNGFLTGDKTPEKSALFTLELAPVHAREVPSSNNSSIPPPPQNVQVRDVDHSLPPTQPQYNEVNNNTSRAPDSYIQPNPQYTAQPSYASQNYSNSVPQPNYTQPQTSNTNLPSYMQGIQSQPSNSTQNYQPSYTSQNYLSNGVLYDC